MSCVAADTQTFAGRSQGTRLGKVDLQLARLKFIELSVQAGRCFRHHTDATTRF